MEQSVDRMSKEKLWENSAVGIWSHLCFFVWANFWGKKSLHWHIQSFENYIKEDINPFGLRVQIFPTFETGDVDFKREWEKTLDKCSKEMMLLRLAAYKKTN